MTGPDAPIRIVLDASAVLAYTRSSVNVGEILAEVGAEDAVAGLPVACLVEAYRQAKDHHLLHLLVDHPATALLPEESDDWRDLAGAYVLTGRYEVASAAQAATALDVAVLTAHPDWYADVNQGGLTIGIDE